MDTLTSEMVMMSFVKKSLRSVFEEILKLAVKSAGYDILKVPIPNTKKEKWFVKLFMYDVTNWKPERPAGSSAEREEGEPPIGMIYRNPLEEVIEVQAVEVQKEIVKWLRKTYPEDYYKFPIEKRSHDL
jgi:hypothetical protein